METDAAATGVDARPHPADRRGLDELVEAKPEEPGEEVVVVGDRTAGSASLLDEQLVLAATSTATIAPDASQRTIDTPSSLAYKMAPDSFMALIWSQS